MKNQHIVHYLNDYITLEAPHYAVLLKGNWGSGKTFFIKSLIKQWQENENIDDENITLQPIYISLNGINSCTVINEKIKAKVSPFLYSKGMKIAKKIASGLLKTATKIDLDFDKDGKTDGNITFNIDPISIFEIKSGSISGKKILIFDDIERCKIETDEIFGYINDFVEHTDCKIVLLADEEKIKRKYSNQEQKNEVSYKDFKEKLIGQTFEIESDIENAITYFISEIDQNYDSLLLKNKKLIEQIFISSQLENLRVLKQSLLDFNRITRRIETSLTKESVYEYFFKNLLAYFLIVYLEFKTGNEKIREFQGINFYMNEDNEDVKKINEKYNELLTSNNIISSNFIIPIKEILEYIEKGNLDINNRIRKSNLYTKDEEKNWEKLWYWTLLEDDVFFDLKKNVWEDFNSEKIITTTEILHVTGIFIRLINEKLHFSNLKTVVKKSKKLLKNSIKNENLTSEHIDHFGIIHDSWGKEYMSRDTNEFKDIIYFLSSNIETNDNAKKDNYIKEIFNDLTAEKIKNIHSLTKTLIPGSTTYYSDTSFLKNISGKKTAQRIKKLDNHSIHNFTRFLHSRYYPEERFTNLFIEHFHTEELSFIKDLKLEINCKTNKKLPIKNRLLNNLSNELENIIGKLEQKLAEQQH